MNCILCCRCQHCRQQFCHPKDKSKVLCSSSVQSVWVRQTESFWSLTQLLCDTGAGPFMWAWCTVRCARCTVLWDLICLCQQQLLLQEAMQQELFDPCTYQLFSQRFFCKHVNFLPAASSLLLHVCVYVRACVRACEHARGSAVGSSCSTGEERSCGLP